MYMRIKYTFTLHCISAPITKFFGAQLSLSPFAEATFYSNRVVQASSFCVVLSIVVVCILEYINVHVLHTHCISQHWLRTDSLFTVWGLSAIQSVCWGCSTVVNLYPLKDRQALYSGHWKNNWSIKLYSCTKLPGMQRDRMNVASTFCY